jgi:hypothetical protein
MEGPTYKKTKESPEREGKPPEEHQVPKPPPIARRISNKERRGPLERRPNLKKTLTYCNNLSHNKDHMHTLQCC